MAVFKYYFSLFMIYSFIGWTMEVIWNLFTDKKLVNRGFLIGPYCPIYGVGCLLLIILLGRFKSDPVLLFFMSIIVCSILEYSTSYIMEKLFKARWWDYSEYKFNLNGRICAATMIPFGILGVLVVYYLNPFVSKFVPFNQIFFYITFILFILDFGVSFGIIENMKGTITTITKDSTEEITKMVKEKILGKSFLHKRLLRAFPSFISPIDKLRRIVRK
ncbi:MAG: putative ABC transporter permease [Bacilli bacterium]